MTSGIFGSTLIVLFDQQEEDDEEKVNILDIDEASDSIPKGSNL